MTSAHEERNRKFWDADADDYQIAHGEQLERGKVWGAWALPEAELDILGDVRGLDVLEYGCGGAQWAIALAREGANVVALDQSRGQLRHAAANAGAAHVAVALTCASAEHVPFRDAVFDLVFCDHGAMSFCDPDRTVPEAGRMLRAGGRLVFNKATILNYLTYDDDRDRQSEKLSHDYFDSRVYAAAEGTVDFQIPYGEWIRLLGANGFFVEDLVELRPPADATTTYGEFVQLDWARRWPAEEIWIARKQPG